MTQKNNDITVIILNGPPGSGKDTIADTFEAEGLARHIRFKDVLYNIAAAIYCVDVNLIKGFANDQVKKMVPQEIFNGRSQREVLIHTSETVIKPNFGKDYFGQAVYRTVKNLAPKNSKSYFILSDGGFIEEIEVLTANYRTVLVRLHRDGCDFSKDSRNYLYSCTDAAYDVENNADIETLVEKVKEVVGF